MSSTRRRWLLVAVVLVALAAGAGYLLRPTSATDTGPAAAASTPAGPTSGAVPDPRAVVTAPVTTEPPEEVATDAPVTAPDGQADVVLSYAGWDPASSSVQVNAFVGSLVQDGGTCALEVTRGGESHTVSGAASADASTTVCDLLEIPGADLAAGPWQAVVTYTSATSTGSSEPVEVTVP